MGNFQHLAEKILHHRKVSSFPPLGYSTGNSLPPNGNPEGNSSIIAPSKNLLKHRVKLETNQETSGKLTANTEETFTYKFAPQSFSFISNTPVLLSEFFKCVYCLEIDLLPDDKRWLNAVCFGEQISQLQLLLNLYIENWLDAMDQESLVYKKQNAGRYQANCFLHKALSSVKNR